VQRAGAALLSLATRACLETQQLQDRGQADGRPHGGEVDGRPISDRLLTLPSLVLLLANEATALAGLGQLAIALREDLLGPSCELVARGEVADGRVQANIVVQLDNLKPVTTRFRKSAIRGIRGTGKQS